MNNFENIKNLPDISFIENRTIEEIVAEMKKDATEYLQSKNVDINIDTATELNAEINACSMQIYQMANYIDRGAKQNLLKYSYGEFLDNLGALHGLSRNPASKAITKMKFIINAEKTFVVSIPQGTRVSDGNGHIFSTDEYVEIAIGELYVDVVATATEAGKANNDIPIGNINIMVDPVQYVDSVSNVDISSGGAEIETDEAFGERIYLAPSNNIKTGSEDGYIYNVKSYSSAIGDIKVISETPGQVNIYILMNDGTLPSDTLCDEVYDYLYESRRAMTDYVVVSAPTEVSYDINFTYYIEQGQDVTSIQAKVNQAVADYIVWQRKIGRDINADKLTQLVLSAGAKRVVITSPVRVEIDDSEVSSINNVNIAYGGLEND